MSLISTEMSRYQHIDIHISCAYLLKYLKVYKPSFLCLYACLLSYMNRYKHLYLCIIWFTICTIYGHTHILFTTAEKMKHIWTFIAVCFSTISRFQRPQLPSLVARRALPSAAAELRLQPRCSKRRRSKHALKPTARVEARGPNQSPKRASRKEVRVEAQSVLRGPKNAWKPEPLRVNSVPINFWGKSYLFCKI